MTSTRINRWLLLLAVAAQAALLGAGAQAQPAAKPSEPSRLSLVQLKSCSSLSEEHSAADDASDWDSMARLAERLMKECSGLDPRTDSSWSQKLAFAQAGKGDGKGALASVNRCLDLYYRNEQCHVIKVVALLLDRRIDESRAAYRIAKSVVNSSMQPDMLTGETAQDAAQRVKNAEHAAQQLRGLGAKYGLE